HGPSAEQAGCDGYQRFRGSRASAVSGATRRSFLRSSANAAAGVASAGWLTRFAESLARASESKSASSKPAKSLLFIWLQGGPSQLETFDPHPGSKIGGDVKGIDTKIKGVQLADSMPATAEQLHLATVVRSVISKEGDHERASYHLKTGWRPDPTLVHPSIGSVVCHQSEENLEIPRHVSITPTQWPARGGFLGPALDAFQIGDPANKVPNLSARVPEEQMDARLNRLLGAVEDEFLRGRLSNMDQSRTLHRKATNRAVNMMHSEQLAAFDVKQESKATLDQFGDHEFGRGCLAAIRLLKAGVRCVEVELSGWDSHINNHELQYGQAGILDKALAATLQELEAREMLEDTVVFCGGEFGRTPSINPASGRDHWPHGFSTLLAGGRFRRGHVHGATAANIDPATLRGPGQSIDPLKLTEDAITVPDLHATLLKALGVDHEFENMTPIGRPLRWSDGNVNASLFA
ncbi:MAG: DUF1501 domain-containing protein, partial [Planctomycetota bacterium]